MLNMYELIEKKKHGGSFTSEEMGQWVRSYCEGKIPDYQVSALLMAIWFQGLSEEESYALTKELIDSGDRIDLSAIHGTKVDKHSTGGVGDTVSLVLGPMVAALGIPFAKMSGRGLGHTGGTLDKLEAIPGFSIDRTVEEFIAQTNDIGICLAGQTAKVTPGDKKLYALRDATATVDQEGLIAASILSKKIAVGSDALILDVKVGKGAFMKDEASARSLAEHLVGLGKRFGRRVMAVISSMEEPLGLAVGNLLEVQEAIRIMKGEGPDDLKDLCLILGQKLLVLSGEYEDEESARVALEKTLTSGRALETFEQLLKAQGANVTDSEEILALPLSRYHGEVRAEKSGWIRELDALEIGEIARILGAGRATMEDVIDPGAGVLLVKKIGDSVKKDEVIAHLYGSSQEALEEAKRRYSLALNISEEAFAPQPLILGEVGDETC